MRQAQEKKANSAIGLKPFIHPLKAKDFLENYWAQTPYATTAYHKKLKEITQLPELQSVKEALKVECRSIRAWFETKDNNIKQLNVSAEQAYDLYQMGNVTLSLDGIDTGCKPIRNAMESIYRELKSPLRNFGCNLYASAKGGGTRMHFDQQEVFLLQVKGKKEWRYILNEQVRWPLSSCFDVDNLADELEYLQPKFPHKMPAKAKKVLLEEGSVLYMPRGTWHQSNAPQESVALTLTYPSHTMMDVFLDYMKAKLSKQEAWREPAAGLLGRETEARSAKKKINDCIQQLQSMLSGVSAEEITLIEKANELKDTTYKIKPSLKFSVPNPKPNTDQYTVKVKKDSETILEITTRTSMLPVYKWLQRHPSFEVKDFVKQKFDAPRNLLKCLIVTLIDNEILG